MNVLNLFVKIYSKLQNYPGVPLWLMRPLRKAFRSIAWMCVPSYLQRARPSMQSSEIPVVVSFTSFPERINYVWQVVECLFRQTYRPEKIILWLSKKQFSDLSAIPTSLRCRMNDIFEIRFTKGWRSINPYKQTIILAYASFVSTFIISSGYLLYPQTWAYFASLFIFAYLAPQKANYARS